MGIKKQLKRGKAHAKRISTKTAINLVLKSGTLRDKGFSVLENKMYNDLIERNPDNRPRQAQMEKFWMGRALLYRAKLALDEGRLSRRSSSALTNVFLGSVFFGSDARAEFAEEHGHRPPLFITISPTNLCNLRCVGCYNGAGDTTTLPYHVFDRVVTEAKEKWGMHFFVISGGEPLLYKSEGKTFLDLAEKHRDCYFLMYTNGTLIKGEIADRLAETGNASPGISVEGFEKETEARRGPGTYPQIITGMDNCREKGIAFGASLTLHADNISIFSDKSRMEKFIDFYFDELGALYAWIFHYMAIGRGISLSRAVKAEDRVGVQENEWEMVRDRKVFMADFWNSGTSSDGCISAARSGGYFHIMANGAVTPCVFAQVSQHNIIDVYKSGGTLDDVIESELFRRIRKWQDDYAYRKPAAEHGNLLRQCPVRDHAGEFYKIVDETGAKPVGGFEVALGDKGYREVMIGFGNRIGELTDQKWDEKYLRPEREAAKKT